MNYRRNLPLLLLSVRETVRAHFQPTFRDNDITEQQWRILRALYESPGQSVVEIADSCCIMRPSIVGIIARMVHLDLIERERSETDKRRSHVHLTPKGRALVEKLLPVFDRIYRHIEDKVGKTCLDGIYAALDDFAESMQKVEVFEK